MRKRLIPVMLVCCMLFSLLPLTTFAAQPEILYPMWDNTRGVTATLSFNGNTGNVAVTIIGKSGVDNITADIKLYYKNTSGSWVEIYNNWSYDVDQMTLTATESFTGVEGREYKIEVSGSVTKDGYAEPVSKTATATCPRS